MKTQLLDGIQKAALHPFLGAGIGAGTAFTSMVAVDPYLRGTAKAEIEAMTSSEKKRLHEDSGLQKHPQAAYVRARKVAEALRAQGFDPRKHNIAISASGGTGKSTLAALLQKELGVKQKYKERGAESKALGLGRRFPMRVAEIKTEPGIVYEQSHLLNIADPDKFDFIIQLTRPTKEIFKSLKERERGSVQRHILDYPRLKKAISYAFRTLPGKNLSPESGVNIKRRPEEGFKQREMLDRTLKRMGVDPSKMSREEKIYRITGGDTAFYRMVSKLGLQKKYPNVFRPDLNYKGVLAGAGIVGTGALAGGLAAK